MIVDRDLQSKRSLQLFLRIADVGIDGWLRLPIPLFERISDLTEELFRACQGYLGRLIAVPPPLSAVDRALHEGAIREILSRVRALAEEE